MREWIARGVVLLTTLLVVGISAWFATTQNVAGAAAAEANAAPPTAAVARGKKLFTEQGCATCHSIGGAGNPRSQLDQVGSRWEAAELRDWITGSGVAAEMLGAAIVKRKQRYAALPASDLGALVAYLSTLQARK